MIKLVKLEVKDLKLIGINIYLPKLTIRLMYCTKLIVVDECFNINLLKNRCSLPILQVGRGTFEQMLNGPIIDKSNNLQYIENDTILKCAIETIMINKEYSNE